MISEKEKTQLLSKEGIGPWTRDFSFYEDLNRNLPALKKLVPIYSPVSNGKTILERFFYRMYDCRVYYCDQLYNFDFYSTKEALTFRELRPETSSTLSEFCANTLNFIDVRHQLTKSFPNDALTVGLERLRADFLQNGNQSSLEALSVIHNVSKSRRLAHVFADGAMRDFEWVVSDYEGFAPVTKVAQALSKVCDTENSSLYGAIYFAACNPYNLSVIMNEKESEIEIPVIIHSGMNEPVSSSARIIWPSKSF